MRFVPMPIRIGHTYRLTGRGARGGIRSAPEHSRSWQPVTYTGGGLIAVFSAAAAGLAGLGVHHRVSFHVRKRHHDVGAAVFLQLGVIYAVLLAFVFSETWNQYNTAAQAINMECSDLHASVILARELPGTAGTGIERSVIAYITTVIGTEWRLMARRQESPRALADMTAMFNAAGNIEVAQPHDNIIRAQIITELVNAHEQRETRLFQMDQGLPTVLWLLLSIYAVVLTVFVLFAGIEYLMSLVAFTSLFCGLVVSILVLIRMLDFPFEGALALQPTDFRMTLTRINVPANMP